MRISLFSNFLNNHQLPVSKALAGSDGVDFRFVSYARTKGEVGRNNLDSEYEFVIPSYKGGGNLAAALDRARRDDIVIMAPMDGFEPFRDARNESGGLTFLYSERLLKRGQWWRLMPPKRARVRRQFLSFENCEPYVLCSSAFTVADLSKFGSPSGRCLRWGYFPRLDLDGVVPRVEKLPRDMTLCSAQRHIPLKHVEHQLHMLQRLRRRGFELTLRIAGDGPESSRLRVLAVELGVADSVKFLGQLTHEGALALMRNSDVFLATSDRNEGWGATVNEAMAAGCVVVGSSLMGSVPFLVRDGLDGLVYESGNMDSLESTLMRLMIDPGLLPALSASALERMSGLWSAECATRRFLECCKALFAGDGLPVYDDGPMSPAPVLEDDWYASGKNGSK